MNGYGGGRNDEYMDDESHEVEHPCVPSLVAVIVYTL